MQYLALCCIVKDENPYLKEWILYHSLIGVEHFFIYDNGSAIPARESIGALANLPQITILNSPNKAMQLPSYNHCLTEFGSRFAWIAFIDADEFICLRDAQDIRPLLAEYEPYGGLALNWRMFSSNGHESRPGGLVIENYTRYVREQSEHVKSIVRPVKTSGCRNPHAFGYTGGAYCVNEAFSPLPPGAALWFPSHDRMWINHYYYKSREDFAAKLAKGRNSIRQENQSWWNMDRFDEHLELASFEDATITRHAPKLRQVLRSDDPPTPFVPAQGLSVPELLSLGTARLSAGHPEEALVCLCHAAMWQETHDIWNLRAAYARLMRHNLSAEHFLRQAARLGESLFLYAELAELAAAEGDRKKTAEAVSLLRIAMKRSGVTEGPWAQKMEELTERLGEERK